MKTEKIQQLFSDYLHHFLEYDLAGLANCYHLPCTLSTPDKLSFVMNQQDLFEEFTGIFEQLKSAQTSHIVANKASYQQMSDTVFLVSIDWDFFDGNQQVFADFTALYHVVDVEGELKIFNVISHELGNSLSLVHTFSVSV